MLIITERLKSGVQLHGHVYKQSGTCNPSLEISLGSLVLCKLFIGTEDKSILLN